MLLNCKSGLIHFFIPEGKFADVAIVTIVCGYVFNAYTDVSYRRHRVEIEFLRGLAVIGSAYILQ